MKPVGESTETARPVEPDWKHIAIQMAQRLNMAISSFRLASESRGGGLILDMEKGTSQHWKDYFADALELIPGVKVDRELMHMTPAQRRKKTRGK